MLATLILHGEHSGNTLQLGGVSTHYPIRGEQCNGAGHARSRHVSSGHLRADISTGLLSEAIAFLLYHDLSGYVYVLPNRAWAGRAGKGIYRLLTQVAKYLQTRASFLKGQGGPLMPVSRPCRAPGHQ